MKARLLLLTIFSSLFLFAFSVYAENLNSSNFTLIDPELSSTSGTAASSNYKALAVGSNGIGYGKISSALYSVGSGQGYTFMANVPKVTCFETTTDSGTTACVSLPRSNGMIGECGEGGCYDRAMVQIDTQGNPTDTLYSIQVSTDDWNTVLVVDGTSHTLKPYASKTISDYKSSVNWFASPWDHFNIVQMQPNTQYKVRITALHGDFTESSPGPSREATTAMPSLVFDLDIGSDINAESNAPYAASIGNLTPETEKFQNQQRIKLDVSTNAQSGLTVYVKDANSGIRSASTSYLLSSTTEDLSNPASGDGFGLQESGTAQNASSQGTIIPGSDYDLAGSNVGAISSSAQTRVACSLLSPSGVCGVDPSTWVTGGKILLTLGARASLAAPAVGDYEDVLTFTVLGGW